VSSAVMGSASSDCGGVLPRAWPQPPSPAFRVL
jgi:hypothetical protein